MLFTLTKSLLAARFCTSTHSHWVCSKHGTKHVYCIIHNTAEPEKKPTFSHQQSLKLHKYSDLQHWHRIAHNSNSNKCSPSQRKYVKHYRQHYSTHAHSTNNDIISTLSVHAQFLVIQTVITDNGSKLNSNPTTKCHQLISSVLTTAMYCQFLMKMRYFVPVVHLCNRLLYVWGAALCHSVAVLLHNCWW